MNVFKKMILNLVTCFCILVPVVGFCDTVDTILQQEKLEYEKCLEVIDVSSGRLGIKPKNIDQKEGRKIVSFTLGDGLLIIECNGELGEIKVIARQ